MGHYPALKWNIGPLLHLIRSNSYPNSSHQPNQRPVSTPGVAICLVTVTSPHITAATQPHNLQRMDNASPCSLPWSWTLPSKICRYQPKYKQHFICLMSLPTQWYHGLESWRCCSNTMDNQHHGQGASMSSGPENMMKSTKILSYNCSWHSRDFDCWPNLTWK